MWEGRGVRGRKKGGGKEGGVRGLVRAAGELFNIRYGTRAVTGMPHRCIILAIKASIMAGYLLIEYT